MVTPKEKDGISVIVCCYNSADRLPKTLQHLQDQKFDVDIPWEIIIINNASTDNTVEIAKSLCESFSNLSHRFLLADEPLCGLANARQKGVELSNYNFIIFCDDDNWLCEDYLNIVYSVFVNYANVGYIGGCSEAVFESGITKPDWFDDVAYSYAVGKPFKQNGIQNAVYTWGAGMCVRRAAVEHIFKYPFLLTDRNGVDLSSGGDSEICARINIQKYDLYFSENLKLNHFIPSKKLSEEYAKKLNIKIEESNAVIHSYTSQIDVNKKSGIDKMLFFIKEIYRYISPKYKNRRRSASQNLFFLTGISFFGTKNDKVVYQYNKSVAKKSKNKLPDIIDAVYYINLEKRKDRKKAFLNRATNINHHNIIRVEAVDGQLLNTDNWIGTAGSLGVRQSHINLLKKASENKHHHFLAFEDDVIIPYDFSKKLLNTLAHVPNDWDMIYLYAENHVIQPVHINKYIVKLQCTLGLVAVLYNSKKINFIIDSIQNEQKYVDVSMADIQKKLNVYAPVKSIVSHAKGYSDIENKHVDYYKWQMKKSIYSALKKLRINFQKN